MPDVPYPSARQIQPESSDRVNRRLFASGWRDNIHIVKRFSPRILHIVPSFGRDIDKRRSQKRLLRLILDERLALAVQDDQRFLVLAGRMPADRRAGRSTRFATSWRPRAPKDPILSNRRRHLQRHPNGQQVRASPLRNALS